MYVVFNWPLTKFVFRIQGSKFGIKVQIDHKKQKIGAFTYIVPNHSSYPHSWTENSDEHLTLLCIQHKLYGFLSFSLEKRRKQNMEYLFFQTRHTSRLFWKHTFILLKPVKLHKKDKNPSSQPVRPLGPFSRASALSAVGTAIDILCVTCPSAELAVRSFN